MFSVFDIKTSKAYPAIALQIAAYLELARNGTTLDLLFDEGRHLFTQESTGQILPSVTQVLSKMGLAPDYFWVDPWYALRGTHVHKATELHENGALDESTVDDEIAPYLAAYQKFRKEWAGEIIKTEYRMWHPTYRYAGIVDRVIEGNKCYILFLKKNGKYSFEEVKNIRSNLNVFLSALNVMKWKQENLKEGQ
uniref:Putative PD-(D/E)XK nuclease superfamily protein n=1 Tax=viral metagenome TaxID=1070528 RepID=A0A6M3J914_9ZZZZ